MKKLLALTVIIILSGCASPNRLPNTIEKVNFSAVGMVNGSGWNDGAIYEATEEELIKAIKNALAANGMTIHEFSRERHLFKAELPMNLERWATYAGVYYQSISEDKFDVHIIALGTKDVNILTTDSESPLPPKLLSSIQSSLSRIKIIKK